MEIRKEKDKIIVELSFYQHRNNMYDENEEKQLTQNLIGIIAGDDFTISQLNDLSYKDTQQEGPPLIHFYKSKDEFIKLCGELNIEVWEHEICVKCKKTIYGACSWDNGSVCFGCDNRCKG